jgi:hypothetical protein
MGKGIAVWTMSKVVMLIFLLLTFSFVIGYIHILNERVVSDSAQTITMQLKSTMTSLVSTDALNARLTIALPDEIPERTKGVYETGDISLQSYTLLTRLMEDSNGEPYFSWAITLDNREVISENVYIASSWLILPQGSISKYCLTTDCDQTIKTFKINSKDKYVVYTIQKYTDPNTGEIRVYLGVCDISGNACEGGYVV